MAALNSLVMRGLVERKILFSNDQHPDDGWADLSGRLEGTGSQHLSWLARASCTSDIQEKSFKYPDWMISENEYPLVVSR